MMTRSEMASESSSEISSAPLLEIETLSLDFGPQAVLRDCSIRLHAGETLVVLGESGCGKTTLLRVIAGLIPCDTGRIRLDGRSIETSPPAARPIIYLDQEPLLFEHLTVAENIAFAMRLRRRPEREITDRVAEMLSRLDLEAHREKRDWQLSGGQRQRVAFARAVLAQPRLLLLDEPFCSLDSRTRAQMQTLFAELSGAWRLSSIFVTHDPKEALVVGSRFARMSAGRLAPYSDRAAFLADPATGAANEIEFWRRMAGTTPPS